MSGDDYVGKHQAPEGFVPDLVRTKAEAALSALVCSQHVDIQHDGETWRIFPMTAEVRIDRIERYA